MNDRLKGLCKFKIGDAVRLNGPLDENMLVYKRVHTRFVEECPGGIQIHYRLGASTVIRRKLTQKTKSVWLQGESKETTWTNYPTDYAPVLGLLEIEIVRVTPEEISDYLENPVKDPDLTSESTAS